MIERILCAEIPVMGHIGLTPQSVHALGGFKVQGLRAEAARKLVQAAKSLAHAGCYALVLEGVPAPVAELVTAAVDIPVIGIGAGPRCDGQVLVYHDLLGIEKRFLPKFVRRYADLDTAAVEAVRRFAADVRSGEFPSEAESYHMSDSESCGLEPGLIPMRQALRRRGGAPPEGQGERAGGGAIDSRAVGKLGSRRRAGIIGWPSDRRPLARQIEQGATRTLPRPGAPARPDPQGGKSPMKRAYELMIIIDSDVAAGDVEAVIHRVAGLVTVGGATIASTDNWGRREFAYEINHKTEGTYVVWQIVTETPGLPVLERQLRIADDIVRHKLFRLPEAEAARRGLLSGAKSA